MNNFNNRVVAFLLLLILAITEVNTSFAQDTSSVAIPVVTTQTVEATWIISPPPVFDLGRPMTVRYDATNIPNAQFYTIRTGDRAPISGVLLNAEANAWLISQFEYIQNYWITEMNRRVELTLLWGTSEVAGVRVRSETELQALNVRVVSLQEENHLLTQTTERLIRENRRQRILYRFLFSSAAIAVAVGAVTTVVVVTK